jgi:hypothetical protein
MIRERSARRYTGNKSPCHEVCDGKKRFNAFLAECIEAWLSPFAPIVNCAMRRPRVKARAVKGWIETGGAGLYDGKHTFFIAVAAVESD